MELFVAEVPDLLGRIAVQDAVIAEVALQLQMAPVIERVADGQLQRFRPLLELFAVGRAARDVIFIHAVGAHLAPFVMVAAQPDLRDVVEFAVFADLLRIDVAVIVEDRHVLGEVVEQMLRGVGRQQEILVHKRFHVVLSPF